MKIRITSRGIYGGAGEIPVGTEIDVKEAPAGWAGRYDVIGKDPSPGSVAVTNEEPDAELIKVAIEGLDLKNDEHWTKAGLPEVKAVEAALGADVTRAQIEAAAPDAKRPAE